MRRNACIEGVFQDFWKKVYEGNSKESGQPDSIDFLAFLGKLPTSWEWRLAEKAMRSCSLSMGTRTLEFAGAHANQQGKRRAEGDFSWVRVRHDGNEKILDGLRRLPAQGINNTLLLFNQRATLIHT